MGDTPARRGLAKRAKRSKISRESVRYGSCRRRGARPATLARLLARRRAAAHTCGQQEWTDQAAAAPKLRSSASARFRHRKHAAASCAHARPARRSAARDSQTCTGMRRTFCLAAFGPVSASSKSSNQKAQSLLHWLRGVIAACSFSRSVCGICCEEATTGVLVH